MEIKVSKCTGLGLYVFMNYVQSYDWLRKKIQRNQTEKCQEMPNVVDDSYDHKIALFCALW